MVRGELPAVLDLDRLRFGLAGFSVLVAGFEAGFREAAEVDRFRGDGDGGGCGTGTSTEVGLEIASFRGDGVATGEGEGVDAFNGVVFRRDCELDDFDGERRAKVYPAFITASVVLKGSYSDNLTERCKGRNVKQE